MTSPCFLQCEVRQCSFVKLRRLRIRRICRPPRLFWSVETLIFPPSRNVDGGIENDVFAATQSVAEFNRSAEIPGNRDGLQVNGLIVLDDRDTRNPFLSKIRTSAGITHIWMLARHRKGHVDEQPRFQNVGGIVHVDLDGERARRGQQCSRIASDLADEGPARQFEHLNLRIEPVADRHSQILRHVDG